jgi:hypothetical protein
VTDLFDDDGVAAIERRIDAWLDTARVSNPVIEAVDRGEGDERRWYVRMRGEEKDVITVWLTLGQRTLRYETYVLASPPRRAEAVYEHLLRRNERFVGAHFSIGVEDAVFLRGELPLGALTEAELDRILGTLYADVEQVFPILVRLAFAP